MIFLLGVIFGYLISTTVIGVAYIVVRKNKSTIVRGIESFTTTPIYTQTREKMAVLKRKTEAEEAYEHVKSLNADRGGIPDSEL